MRLPIVFICMTIVLDAMGIGLIMPVMPDLLQEVAGADLSEAAIWGGLLTVVFAVAQFMFGPLLGSLSDRYGRRPVLLISLAIMVVDYVIMVFASTIWMLLIARIAHGITAATHSTANAYMADISEPEKKAQNFGLIGASFGIGFILGPLIGGLLADFGPRAPFVAAAGLTVLNLILGFFALPETVTEKTRRAFDIRRANPLVALAKVRELPGTGRLLLVSFLMSMAFFVYPTVWAYYGVATFGWDPSMIGISLAVYGLASAVVQGLLMRHIVPRFGEMRIAILGLTLEVGSFIAFALAFETWHVFAIILATSLGVMTQPAVQALLSRAVPDNAQGELQGVTSSLQAIAAILSPLIMTQSFGWFTSPGAPIHLPGAPFLISAGMMVVALIAILGWRRSQVATAMQAGD